MCVSVCLSVINLDKLSHFQLHNNIIDGTLNMVEMWCEPYSGWGLGELGDMGIRRN